MSFNKVDDFLSKLAAAAPKSKEDLKMKNRTLEKIYLNFPGNFGRYQVLPMDNVVTDFPFVTLFGTREINMPRKNISSDGQETVYNAWIKLLPKSGYLMKDPTGRVISSLTAEEDQLLSQAHMVFDQLYEELDAKNNQDIQKNLIRKRNYTIFHGYCINKWNINDSRSPEKQNFSGLFVCTAKGFTTAIEDNISETTLMNNEDNSWIPLVYNRQLSNRDGFLMFTIALGRGGQVGYSVSASHQIGKSKSLEAITIPEEDAELMTDPVSTFLGWQANKEDEQVAPQCRRLFNANLIRETLTYMSQQLAAIRMAKQTGDNILDAIEKTNQMALANQAPTNTMGQVTNDPMLASMTGVNPTSPNIDRVVDNNSQPYSTPPAAHVDPLSGTAINAPTNGGFNSGFGTEKSSAPFSATFGSSFGNNSGNGDLPF